MMVRDTLLVPFKDEGATIEVYNKVLMMNEKEIVKKEKEDEVRYTLLNKSKTIR